MVANILNLRMAHVKKWQLMVMKLPYIPMGHDKQLVVLLWLQRWNHIMLMLMLMLVYHRLYLNNQ
jgi:hypothetical protein